MLFSRNSGIPKDKKTRFTFLFEVESKKKNFITTNNVPVISFEGEPKIIKRRDYLIIESKKDLLTLDILDVMRENERREIKIDDYIILVLKKNLKKFNILTKCTKIENKNIQISVKL